MTAKIQIQMTNAAFTDDGDNGRNELARILRDLSDRLEAGNVSGTGPSTRCQLRDINGNTVGALAMEATK